MIKHLLAITALLSTLLIAQSTQKVQPLEFQLKTIDNTTIIAKAKKNGLDFPAFKGKVVLLELWGTHCPPCLFSIPHYIDLTKKYKDKLAMVAIEVQATPKKQLKAFVKSKGINYNILTQAENMNFVRYIAARSAWRGAIPYLLIFDTKGDVATIKRGMVSEEYIQRVIQYLTNPKTNLKNESQQSESKK